MLVISNSGTEAVLPEKEKLARALLDRVLPVPATALDMVLSPHFPEKDLFLVF